LDAVNHLYYNFGFIPIEQIENNTWKKDVVKERWELLLEPI